ncbi:MAG: hypothetical protein OXF27_07785 [Acidobacteria bacterium]|nr:hypothetical protein [Acidobacteriota bacterium]
MPAHVVIRFRADLETGRLLDKLRSEKAVNVSAWLRQRVRLALEQEFPDETAEPQPDPPPAEMRVEPDPRKTPIEGWKPRRLPGGQWGAVLEGERVAALADSDQLPGTPLVVTDSRGESWHTVLTEVVDRSDTAIVVTHAGRPRQ